MAAQLTHICLQFRQARHTSPHSPHSGGSPWVSTQESKGITDSQATYSDHSIVRLVIIRCRQPVIDSLYQEQSEEYLQDYSADMQPSLLDFPRDHQWERYHHDGSESLLLSTTSLLTTQSRFGYEEADSFRISHGSGTTSSTNDMPRIKINTALPSPSVNYSTPYAVPSPSLNVNSYAPGFPLTPSTINSTLSPVRPPLHLEVTSRTSMSPSGWGPQYHLPSSPYLPTPARSPSEHHGHLYGDGTMVPAPHHTHRTVVELAQPFHSLGHVLPQRTYRPHTQSDRRRYVEEVDLEEPIMFYMQNPEGCGIQCRDALNSKFMRLSGRDDPMFINRGPSVSIRLCWPGYAPWSRQIPTRDFRTPPGPITRSKLAKNVAKTVQRFIDVSRDYPL